MKFPTDITAANNAWGANCGPCALAAILELEVAAVQPFLETFAKKRCMTPTDMKAALKKADAGFYAGGLKVWPEYGLVFIQWGGYESRPVVAQYQHTHGIAVEGEIVFEVNMPPASLRLMTRAQWEAVAPKVMQDCGEGNGTFSIRAVIEVARPVRSAECGVRSKATPAQPDGGAV